MFTWTNLLVVVAELDGGENEALDLVPLVTNVVLEVLDLLFFLLASILFVLIVTNADPEILDLRPSFTLMILSVISVEWGWRGVHF